MNRSARVVRTCWIASVVVGLLFGSGCIKPRITLFPGDTEPLEEYTLQGEGKEKILIVSINGFISDSHRELPLYRRSSMVQEIVSHLKKAEKDPAVKAVLLKIDSPGGSVTASDMLYHELSSYKERSGVKLLAVMMGTAASGGYYVALPADYLIAHPTTVTGSIGVIFLRPNVAGLMEKVGLSVSVNKSGRNKDIGSPFRPATEEEQQIMQHLIDDLAARFLTLVTRHRTLSAEARAEIAAAGIYTADEALRLGLIDRIGYLDDALQQAIKLAGLTDNARVVVYRRAEYPDDNLYNPVSGRLAMPAIHLVDLGLAEAMPPLRSGFYYLWLPAWSE